VVCVSARGRRHPVSPIESATSILVTAASEQADADGVTASHQPIAVMLNLVDPIGSGGWAFSRRWKAGFDKAGRSTLQHAGS
jgi:hypothetical protein